MTNKPTWEIEFYTKFGADKIWVKPSKDNVQTIFDIENFISAKLAEQRQEIIESILAHKFNFYGAYKALRVGKEIISKSKPETVVDAKELIEYLNLLKQK